MHRRDFKRGATAVWRHGAAAGADSAGAGQDLQLGGAAVCADFCRGVRNQGFTQGVPGGFGGQHRRGDQHGVRRGAE